MAAVLLCQKQPSIPSIETRLESILALRQKLYSQNPYIFFGVGLKIVRYAIETQSESLAMMFPAYFFSTYPLCEQLPQYKPCYFLPTTVINFSLIILMSNF